MKSNNDSRVAGAVAACQLHVHSRLPALEPYPGPSIAARAAPGAQLEAAQ